MIAFTGLWEPGGGSGHVSSFLGEMTAIVAYQLAWLTSVEEWVSWGHFLVLCVPRCPAAFLDGGGGGSAGHHVGVVAECTVWFFLVGKLYVDIY